jgi:RHS repeat-associated protein
VTTETNNGVTTTRTYQANYTYDPLDRVVEETEDHTGADNDRTTGFTFQGLTNLVTREQRRDTTGTITDTKTYGYDAYGHRISLIDDPGAEGDTGGAADTFTYGHDVHGSISQLLTTAGQVQASYGYTAYGGVDATDTQALTTGDTNALAPFNPYRYSDKRLDSGLATTTSSAAGYDMGARRYGPDTTRFLEQDIFHGALANLGLTLDPLTQNPYSLAGGNPISFVEWDGHMPLLDGEGAAAPAPAPTPRTVPDSVCANVVTCESVRTSTSGSRGDGPSGGDDGSRLGTPAGPPGTVGADYVWGPNGTLIPVGSPLAWRYMPTKYGEPTRCEPGEACYIIGEGAKELAFSILAALGVRIGGPKGATVTDLGESAARSASRVAATTDLLTSLAAKARTTIGAGRGPVYGTRVHAAFASEIRALGRTDVSSEVSYLGNERVGYGTRGSVRVDAVLGDPDAPAAIFDLKTGGASLTESRIVQIRDNLPVGYQNIPIIEIR